MHESLLMLLKKSFRFMFILLNERVTGFKWPFFCGYGRSGVGKSRHDTASYSFLHLKTLYGIGHTNFFIFDVHFNNR